MNSSLPVIPNSFSHWYWFFHFFSCRECTLCVRGVSSFYEFCTGVGNSQIQQSLQLQEMFLSFCLSPSPSAVWHSTQPSWLGCPGVTLCTQELLPSPSLQHISRELWDGACISPRIYCSYSLFCEYTGVLLVCSTNKIILPLILTLPVL